MIDFENLLQVFYSQSEKFGAVSEDTVMSAENELGVSFPEEYKQFLYNFGALIGNGIEIYGLPIHTNDTPPLWQNVVTVTKRLREYHQVGTEDSKFIPISSDGMDMNYFMNTNKHPYMEIWAIGHETKIKIASNLNDFIINKLLSQ
ncbi:SMI1/KNR4 family protein [Uruburuella testudinis]|uniref:SMI1/KNR4 family protein n=1 Tax=Uruburuella testudinis TaxID=1282863 RepID=A0ABY4DXE0_9NEIS|nr:SMI1/KNR4 family protein [Uruburuella testudinis]UOO82749.1 SMI1/KNR4 family protein [Uruburuella testudinis]